MLSVFNNIIEMTLKASVVILLILIVRLFIRKAPKKFSYMLWAVAGFRLCVPYSFKAIFSVFQVGGKETIGEQISKAVEQTPSYVPSAPIVDTPIINNAVNTTINTSNYTPPVTTPPVTTPPIDVPSLAPDLDISQAGEEVVNAVADKTVDWGVVLMQIALILWIIGFLTMAIYGIFTYIKTHRRMQSRILSKDNIYFSDKIDTPFSMGFFKPKIYLPFGLTDEEQECIIAHEKCHIKRFDHIVKLFSYLLLCVHWFNPMCWIAFNRMTYDMETSCDEMVFASGISEEKKKQYSLTLVSVGTKKRFPTPAPINFDGISNTKSRIKNILKLRKTKVWIKIVCYILCAVVLFACAADVSENLTETQVEENTSKNETDSSQSETDNSKSETDNSQVETDNSQNEINMPTGLINDAILNTIKIVTEDGGEVLINDFTESRIAAQAVVDLDSDGKQEAVLELEGSTGFIILREYNSKVYAYYMVYRGLLNLKTDGTYFGTSGMSDHSISRMSFDGSKMVETLIAESRYNIELDKMFFTINGEDVSEKDYNEFYNDWSNKKGVVFTSVNSAITFLQGSNRKEYTASVNFEGEKAFLHISSIDEDYTLPLDFYDPDSINATRVKPYAMDVTFGGDIDIVVPVEETHSGIYYSAFVFDYATGKFKYVPHFERFSNFVLDTEYKRILAYRQGDMQNYYAYCRYNSDAKNFETTNCVLFECVDPDNYTYNFKESKYEGGVWTDVATYTLTGNEYYSVKGINAEIDENYYSEGSFWELDSPKWKGEAENDITENTLPVIIETPDLNLLNNGEYNIYIEPKYENLGDEILFVAKEKVTDFKLIEIDYNFDYEPLVGETIYSQAELTPEGKPLYITTMIDTMPFRGIQYTDKNGAIRTFRIWYDTRGESDSSYYLSEFSTDNPKYSGETNSSLFEVGIATDEMCQNNENTIYFADSHSYLDNNYNLYIKPNIKMHNFKFIELDESEVLKVEKTLYEITDFSNKTFVVSTYINDAMLNRGFSFIDEDGQPRYFAFEEDSRGVDETPIRVIEITDGPTIDQYSEFVDIATSFYYADTINDTISAREMMDSPNNPCLQYFGYNLNSEHLVIKNVEIIDSKEDENGNIAEVNLVIVFTDVREGYEDEFYMDFNIKRINDRLAITYFDFET